MGLDMYLFKKHYVENFSSSPESINKVVIKRNGKIRNDIKPENIVYVVEKAIYWRKANQIHRWFVENVQDGVDNCGTYHVPREKLEELLETCKIVLKEFKLLSVKTDINGTTKNKIVIENPEVVEELLPTQSGFFFGNTEYDEYYYEDIKYTVENLEKILSEDYENKFVEYEYSSSW